MCAEIDRLGEARGRRTAAVSLPDANPVTPGHRLILPTRHVERVTELQESEWLEFTALVRQELLEAEAHPEVDGVTLGLNSGEAAGQTVPHAHIHLIPRRAGDCPDPRGGVRWVVGKGAAYWETDVCP
ncbi:MAG TPA: HIT domain-containing protein [Solirubrobacterales bacterium]|nr:HIT domain-containing protein [Solirubrobacterales bacterium]